MLLNRNRYLFYSLNKYRHRQAWKSLGKQELHSREMMVLEGNIWSFFIFRLFSTPRKCWNWREIKKIPSLNINVNSSNHPSKDPLPCRAVMLLPLFKWLSPAVCQPCTTKGPGLEEWTPVSGHYSRRLEIWIGVRVGDFFDFNLFIK